jgi:hypothetical protein
LKKFFDNNSSFGSNITLHKLRSSILKNPGSATTTEIQAT